jgi:hypothetical protein
MLRMAQRYVAVVLALMGAAGATAQPVHVPMSGTALGVDVAGNVFVLDRERATLTLFDAALRQVATSGGHGWESGSFDQPSGLWAGNGLDIYVADYGNHRIQRFDRTLTFVSSLSTRSSEDNTMAFGYPLDVTVSRFGTLYICDTENNRIVRVDASNKVEGTFGGFGGGAGKLEHPLQVVLGPSDQVYVLDPPRVLVFDLFGNFLHVLSEGLLQSPKRIAGDERGIVVADGRDLVFFSGLHRPVLQVPITDVTGAGTPDILSLCLAGGRLYVLTEGMLHILPDPRGPGTGGSLDKEPDNH